MHGLGDALSEIEALAQAHPDPGCEILICPPATLLHRAAQAAQEGGIALGGQDCHAEAAGAHTGDVSAAMLRDAGARYVILGHSERRADHGETDAQVRAKAEAALAAELLPVICVGETLEDREAGRARDVVTAQLSGSLPHLGASDIVIAYEPVWAIGTGRVPGTAEIGEMHETLRAVLMDRLGAAKASRIRLLYGGSVKGSNAAEIFAVPDVDGALVGGASLTAADFSPIVAALAEA